MKNIIILAVLCCLFFNCKKEQTTKEISYYARGMNIWDDIEMDSQFSSERGHKVYASNSHVYFAMMWFNCAEEHVTNFKIGTNLVCLLSSEELSVPFKKHLFDEIMNIASSNKIDIAEEFYGVDTGSTN